MNNQTLKVFQFGEFSFNPNERTLTSKKGSNQKLQKKTSMLLLYLITNYPRVIPKEELFDKIWEGKPLGDDSISYQVRMLRKSLNDDANQPAYIETLPGSGYRFMMPVEESTQGNILPLNKVRRPWVWWLIFLVLCATVSGSWWIWKQSRKYHSPFDEAEISRVVKESQFYETLKIYTDPKGFDKNKLNEYWLPASQGGQEILKVEKAINGLLDKGWHYSNESRNEIFEFREITIYPPGDSALVETLEKWYVPTYKEDGSMIKDRNVYIGPQNMAYKLRKVNGVWLIYETTVPRRREN
jgi:DNA-binding winged helix-turn-helix (wHTH) protein